MHPGPLSVLVGTALAASCQVPPSRVAPQPPAVDGARAPAPARVAAGPADVPPLVGLGGDRYLAAVSVEQRRDECSGAGGEHYVFSVDGDAARVHGGGHAVYLDLVPAVGPPTTAWFVAELQLEPRRADDGAAHPDVSRAGWCLTGLPRTDGSVLRLIAADDRDDARRTLARVARTGLPRAVVIAGAPAATDALAIVRVRERRTADRVAVDAVVGAAPAELAVGTLPAWTGDLLVVAVAGAGAAAAVTGALLADDLADARRWHAVIAADGWPPAAREVAWAGAASAARWAVVGRRVHDPACGDELHFGDGEGSAFVLRPGRAALPPGLAATDLAAVVVPQRADGCGRTARVVRAYAADPRGGRWIAWGQAAVTAAVVE